MVKPEQAKVPAFFTSVSGTAEVNLSVILFTGIFSAFTDSFFTFFLRHINFVGSITDKLR